MTIRVDVGFSKVLIDNTIGRNKKNWLGNFKELGRVGNFQSFNNQNAITQYMGSCLFKK
jgi:hypothetical protein